MTPDQINIAIAESLGWTAIENTGTVSGWLARHFNIGTLWDRIFGTRELAIAGTCPNYHSSLDACAEFESALTEDEHRTYAWYLVQVSDPYEQFGLWKSPGDLSIWEMTLGDCFTCATAKPSARCEARLRMLGKWTTSTQQPT